MSDGGITEMVRGLIASYHYDGKEERVPWHSVSVIQVPSVVRRSNIS